MKRPLSLTIIGTLVLLQGIAFGSFGSLTLALYLAPLSEALPRELLAELPAIQLRELLPATAALMLGTFGLVSGVGILRLRPWSWVMAMITQGINLATELANYTRGHANYLSMVASVVIVLYLNQRDVQRAFNAALHRTDPEGTRTAQADAAAAEEAQREAVESR
jgi:hypothetical protein